MATSLPPGGRRVSKAASRTSVGISPPRRKESPVPACRIGLYRDLMPSLRSRLMTGPAAAPGHAPARRTPIGRATAVVTALWSPVTWRATRNALTGLLVAAITVVVLGLPCVVWGAALFSVTTYANNPWHIALYVATILFIPVVLPWLVLGQTALQRSRLHATLGLEFPHALRAASRGPWPFGPWRAVATWRQLGYHVISLVTGLIGGA